ncbi:AraC family transcriptional regulator [Streptomyces spiroverticillatus]|uniref:AraC family transcriptional regulator n=1 Tax=Streptomyces finlayi TaxID=67296 RepID=A0A919C8U7_9ACTN|nr:helix-turn-helix transcriptional regulator [Streptomyces finlayi]GHA02375.1 AraC family transcriptional regulator [Streptomyces spiroverticillatus]GHC86582.1 AraC family transcriptional regulator [Streptomyces finlayi]
MPGTYRERPSLLDGAVLWRREADPAPAPDAAAYPVLPDGCMDLVLLDGRLIVAGPDTRAHGTSDSPGGRFAGIRFAPGTGAAFLGVPAHALRDLRVPLDEVWAKGVAREASGRIAEAADPLLALEEFALRRAADAGPWDPVIRAVAAGLEAGATVGAAADAVGLGARQLHRRSLDAFGYGPKTLARVLRLQRALGLVREGTPFAEAAYRSGCADQAHLAREARELAGMTLRAYTALMAARYARSSAKIDTPSPSGSSTTA